MNVSVNKGVVEIRLLVKEERTLDQARELLAQIGKHGDCPGATEAATNIVGVLRTFCPPKKTEPAKDTKEKKSA